MSIKWISVREEEGIFTIILRRPPLNVLNMEMMNEINDVLEGVKERNDLKALVIRAEGKAFSAGVDVGEHIGDIAPKMIETFHRMFRLLAQIELPTVALCQGSVLGGGCELATFCDFVIASHEAVFGQPEIKVGVFPPVACLHFPSLIGRSKALELILTGETVSAEEALRIGLVTKVVPLEKLDEELDGFLKKFKKLSAPVLRYAKKATLVAHQRDFEETLKAIEDIYLNELMMTEDANEGLKAFLEKRKPVWKNI